MRQILQHRPTSQRELREQLIMNAAFVTHETFKAKKAMRWLRKPPERQFVYVFDTDLVTTWCAPWRTGPVNPISRGDGYGQILPQKILGNIAPEDIQTLKETERSQAEAVAWLLASRALSAAFNSETPSLLTTAHFEETMTVYEHVKRIASAHADVSRQASDSRLNHQLASTLRAVRNNLDQNQGSFNARNAGAHIGNILKLIDQRERIRAHGAVLEWDAFRDIIRIGNGLFKLTEHRLDENKVSQSVVDIWNTICDDIVEGRCVRDIDDLTSLFLRPIEGAKSSLNAKNSQTDARSIAEIAYFNRRLEDEQINLRVVLITGDRSIAFATANDRNPDIRKFAVDHVRHLWSFVDLGGDYPNTFVDKDTPGLPTTSGPGALFSGLLAFEDDSEDDDAFEKALLKNMARPDTSHDWQIEKADIVDAYRRWDTYTEQASDTQKHYLFDEDKCARISEIIVRKLDHDRTAPQNVGLLDIVKETTARARDRANVEFSGIGANSLLDSHKNGVRNPPELMFDSLPIADAIFKDLALPERVFQTVYDFTERFDRISANCYQPDPNDPADDDFRQECYLKYLVLGALFASANRWIVAEQHAENAVRIIQRAKSLRDPIRTRNDADDEPASHMSGREGYFLLASSKRVRAKSDRVLDEARNMLKIARSCLDEDRQKGTASGVSYIRFESEELAIALSAYYTAREKAVKAVNKRDPDTVDMCDIYVRDIYRAASSLLKTYNEMHRKNEDANAPKGDRLDALPTGTKTSIATNLVQVYIISEYRRAKEISEEEESPVDSARASREIDVLIQHSDLMQSLGQGGFGDSVAQDRIEPGDDQPSIICSSLMMLYALVGDLLLGTARFTIFEHNAVGTVFRKYQTRVTHYDSWRYKALADFTKTTLKKNR